MHTNRIPGYFQPCIAILVQICVNHKVHWNLTGVNDQSRLTDNSTEFLHVENSVKTEDDRHFPK